ncbi:hypothetical protein [Bradyrhizobium erythrophlei]|jgi:hypothetical protein|uniref:Uncharacterized protein n=1 Tax=Bradyrhizobium erythrophlei TaxID=1437360 RepID=A0A1M5JD61_9BRAD|nr:hypothetical protein [Bradyrhizobium erythrophlei]SHG38478.1 hypothetical protein SAMN05444169_2146 [Bradyrhizobium erythrophlei]
MIFDPIVYESSVMVRCDKDHSKKQQSVDKACDVDELFQHLASRPRNYRDSALNTTRRAGPSASSRLGTFRVHSAELRVKPNFLSRIKLILPVQSRLKKYSVFPKSQISLYPQPFTPLEGRIAIVTDAGLDAMDAGGAKDESVLLADGEVVWS